MNSTVCLNSFCEINLLDGHEWHAYERAGHCVAARPRLHVNKVLFRCFCELLFLNCGLVVEIISCAFCLSTCRDVIGQSRYTHIQFAWFADTKWFYHSLLFIAGDTRRAAAAAVGELVNKEFQFVSSFIGVNLTTAAAAAETSGSFSIIPHTESELLKFVSLWWENYSPKLDWKIDKNKEITFFIGTGNWKLQKSRTLHAIGRRRKSQVWARRVIFIVLMWRAIKES